MGEIPAYFRADHKKHKGPQKQERRVAKKVGGHVQKASGSLPFNKGDVKAPELLIECKRTKKLSISITRKWLDKITREASAADKTPALAIEFEDTRVFSSELPRTMDTDWVLIPASFLREMLSLYRETEDD